MSNNKNNKNTRGNKSNNNNNGNNSRRNNNKSNIPTTCDANMVSKKDGRGFSKSTDNDASWYNTLPELVRDAAKFPFSRPLGTHYVPRSDSNVQFDFQFNTPSIPGIMCVNWYPTIGLSAHSNSPINIVSREVYSFVRHANSGHANYDAPDLMLYFMAMDSVYSLYSEAVRVYGMMMLYTANNRYYPKALVQSAGWDFTDVQRNLAQLRWAINQFAYKLGSLAIPANMSYFARHIWLNSGLYLDSNSAKAQTYMFKQDAHYKYNPTVGTGFKSQLEFTKRTSNKMTVNDWIAKMNSFIDPILASEDFNIMSGDILKAFGQDNLFTVAPIAEEYVVVPSYSTEVLSQIQNLSIMGYPDTTISTRPGEAANIVQRIDGETWDPGLYQVLTFTTKEQINKPKAAEAQSLMAATMERLISMLADDPSPDEIMVATRLTNICDTFGIEERVNGANKYYRGIAGITGKYTYGTEIVSSVTMVVLSESGNFKLYTIDTSALVSEPTSDSNLYGDLSLLRILVLFEAFDWHPTIPVMGCNYNVQNNTNPKWIGYLQETNNFTVMNIEDLTRLHETALISEFAVPQIASLSRKPFRG